ncbi:hypothetical protein EFD56_27335 [Rhizobium phaseoli]|nr:hypothetical protein EFD56_27335 [Rhizobium phaseoli]
MASRGFLCVTSTCSERRNGRCRREKISGTAQHGRARPAS